MSKAQRWHRSLRSSASFLLAEGHPYAHYYPLSKLWLEAELARERVNQQHITNATLMHALIVDVMSPKKTNFLEKQIKKLTNG